MTFKSTNLIFIISRNLLVALFVAVVSLAAVKFLAGQIAKISYSMREQRILALVLEKRSETLARLKEDFKIIDGADQQITEALPPADNILEFVSALEDLAAETTVEQSLSFMSPSDSMINYDININANINSLVSYLKKFEKLAYFTGISGINLSAAYGDWNSNSSVSLRAKVYTK